MSVAQLTSVLRTSACCAFLVFVLVHALGSEQDAEETNAVAEFALKYDGRVGPVRVGKLEALLTVQNDTYELDGSIVGTGPLKRLLKWQGEFTAKGVFQEERPITTSYQLTESEKRGDETEIKIIRILESTAFVSETGKPDIEIPAPEGIDMMSFMLVNASCAEDMVVHDGEDPFQIKLKHPGEDRKLRQGRKYYSGEAEMCRYEFIYDEDEIRKVDIWLAEVDGRKVPVRIRIRIPVIPDGVFKLRLLDDKESEISSP